MGVSCDWNSSGACVIGRKERIFGTALVFEGIRHILLTGYDHLLFVAALLLAVKSLWDLIKVIHAFTLAHTLTLTVATLGILRLTLGQIEPVIAASIVAVAGQNLSTPEPRRAWQPHSYSGCSLVSVLLADLSRPWRRFPSRTRYGPAAFSLGVEIGHELVVLPLFTALYAGRRYGDPGLVKIISLRAGYLLIGAAGLYYLALALRVI